MTTKLEIQKLLAEALQKCFAVSKQPDQVHLERPADYSHGDWASNIPMVLAKELKQNPKQIAEKLVAEISADKGALLQSVEVAGPGFINFLLRTTYISKVVSDINEQFGQTDLYKGRKMMAEFTDPNPFKELHIGHLYSNSVGESISRMAEFAGADVRRACYQGDVGLHVAKAIWGIRKLVEESKVGSLEQFATQLSDISAKAKFLGVAYATGSQGFESDEQTKAEIIEINKEIYAGYPNPEKIPEYKLGRDWSLNYFEFMYQRTGTNYGKKEKGKSFDYYYFEGEISPRGKKFVEDNLDKGIFEKSEGAVIFPGEKYGLHNRVFINSLGLPTYEAKELALAPKKQEDYPHDISVIITGNEIKEYFKVLLKALSLINPEIAAKIQHLPHGMVRLPEGKMSSRKGNVLTAEWLIDEVKSLVVQRSTDSGEGGQRISEEAAEKIAIGAIKYAFLRVGIGGDIEFNLDEATNFQGDSGTYLLYTFVRIQSILAKASEQGLDYSLAEVGQEAEVEVQLAKHLLAFPDVVAAATVQYAPHLICNYTRDLARLFNQFYSELPVLKAEASVRLSRLKMLSSTACVLKNALMLLGIETVDKM